MRLAARIAARTRCAAGTPDGRAQGGRLSDVVATEVGKERVKVREILNGLSEFLVVR